MGRIKPWEAYKFSEEDDAGLLGLLSQREIDAVQVVYFTQEDQREGEMAQEASEKDKDDTSQSEARFLAAMKGRKLLPL